MKRRISIITTILILSLTMSACGNDDKKENKTTELTTANTEISTSETTTDSIDISTEATTLDNTNETLTTENNRLCKLLSLKKRR